MAYMDHARFLHAPERLKDAFLYARDLLRQKFPNWFIPAPPQPPEILLLPPPELPKQFEFFYAGITIKGERFLTPDAKKTLIFSLGHGATTSMYHFFAKALNRLKVNVVMLELPRPENGRTYRCGMDIVDGYEIAASKGLLSDNSPVYEGIPHSHPTTLLTHSSSGTFVERVLFRNKLSADFASQKFCRIIHGSPLLDTADSSEKYNPFRNMAFSKLAHHFPNNPIGSGWIEKKYLRAVAWWEGKDLFEASPHGALYAEGHAIKKAGIEQYKRVENALATGKLNQESRFMKIPRVFLGGNNDKAAEHRMVRDYAVDLLKQKFIPYNGKHCFITQAYEPVFWIIGMLKENDAISSSNLESKKHAKDFLALPHQAAALPSPVRALHAV